MANLMDMLLQLSNTDTLYEIITIYMTLMKYKYLHMYNA